MKELDAEWEKLEGGAVPTRFLRSEQAAAETAAASGGGGGDDDAGEAGDEGGVMSAAPVAIDPYDLADPVDMLGKMPKNFYEQLVSKTSNGCQSFKKVLASISYSIASTPPPLPPYPPLTPSFVYLYSCKCMGM